MYFDKAACLARQANERQAQTELVQRTGGLLQRLDR